MPEAPALRRILLVTTVLLAAAGALEIGRGAGLRWTYWILVVLSALPWIVTIELTMRALARMFLPPPQALDARAVTDSIFLALITGGPRAPGMLLRDHLGLDFTRSWALSYLMAAALPAVFATALLCWGLSGLKLIDLDQRGIYERFGAPVAVLGPGIHLLLPWPVGIMRPQEFGTLHEIKVGSSRPDSTADNFAAEAVPPASSNHLWDTADPTEAQYLVASQSGNGAQGFQVVDAEIHVVYRTGLTDADAMAAVYSAADPAALISGSASRIAALYFASHTLDSVMGAQRDALAEFLRTSLAQDIAAYHTGIEIVSVHIESVHPPAGAAAAYHAVQAAEINANASVFNETGRAKRMAGVADEEAHQMVDASQATASEKVLEAKGDAFAFAADRKGYAAGPGAFIAERTFSNLVAALTKVRLTIIDSRISPAQSPIIDLRGDGTASAGAKPATPAPATPATVPLTPGVEDGN
jgi:regulator of protease activity HflC (stomatin/prohibitin superfamily)